MHFFRSGFGLRPFLVVCYCWVEMAFLALMGFRLLFFVCLWAFRWHFSGVLLWDLFGSFCFLLGPFSNKMVCKENYLDDLLSRILLSQFQDGFQGRLIVEISSSGIEAVEKALVEVVLRKKCLIFGESLNLIVQ